MRILSLDPGNTKTAFIFLEEQAGKNPRIGTFGIQPNDEVLDTVASLNPDVIDAVVIEMIASYGMAVGVEIFETVFWIGRFFQASPVPAHRIFRKDIKLHLCGQPRAKDANIRQALIDRYGKAGTKKQPGPTLGISKDVWSSLAVGTTWLDTKGGDSVPRTDPLAPADPGPP